MAQTSVAQFASELKVPPSVLLEQLRAAGVDKKQPNDSLSELTGVDGERAKSLIMAARAHWFEAAAAEDGAAQKEAR